MGYGNRSGCMKWFYDITEIAITAKVMLPNQGFLVVNEKSSLGKLYCRHHDLDNRYAVSVSQMITDMFRLSYSQTDPFLIHDLSSGV